MRRALSVAGALLAMIVPRSAAADVTSGADKLLHGDYDGARADLSAVRGGERGAAQLLLARLDLHVGALAEAEKRTVKLMRGGARSPVTIDARALAAELDWRRGRLGEARKALEDLVAKHPQHLRGRYLLGMVYREQGELELANAVFELFFSDYAAGTMGMAEPTQALYLGLAARHLRSFEDANEAFREAVRGDDKLLDANLEWGHLFLEKYAAAYAEQSFDDVLKIDPRHPDAHAGMARVKLEQSYNVAAARHHLEAALKVNPSHVPSLLIRAELEIDGNQWTAARATIDQVLAVNPHDLQALSLLATVAWLRDDANAFADVKQRVLAKNPRYAALYHVVARSAVREHRYAEAIALEEQAVALDPGDHEAMGAIGTGYLRLGDEPKGLEWLRRAWQGDEYNVRTYNMLDLFEQVIPRDYVFASTAHFKIRYHKDEQALLGRYAEPRLERAYADMVARYGFEPAGPIVIELFQDPDHYSVRTVGLPNLGALGVCFGRVITAMSPSGGNINWAMVLWHELSHVFAIQLSGSRVPRWYTEGLSEYETVLARPEWRRENDADVWAALEEGTLPSVADLSHGFTKPSMQEVMVAYHLSSLTIEYIATTYGFDKVVAGLRLYGKGLETPAVLAGITGRSVAELDADLRAYLRKRLAVYQGSFRLPSSGLDDIVALEAATVTSPDDSAAWARLGLGHFYAGDADQAQTAMTRALALDDKNLIALFVAGELALRDRDRAGAKVRYEAILAAGADGYDVRGRLGMLAASDGDLAAAEAHLRRAKALDPERSEPYLLLAELYREHERPAEALAELERYVRIEQMQYAPLKQLVSEHARLGNQAKVRELGELALDVNPYDGELLMTLARAYLDGKQTRRALHTFDSALLAHPELRRPALAHLGRARASLALADRKNAARALRAALELEPNNGEAQALKKKLRLR
jgi:tetratricopeptide (TPR) repeat protein